MGSNSAGGTGVCCKRGCCQVVSASGWSFVQRNPTECGASEDDREASMMRRVWPIRGCRAKERNNRSYRHCCFKQEIHCMWWRVNVYEKSNTCSVPQGSVLFQPMYIYYAFQTPGFYVGILAGDTCVYVTHSKGATFSGSFCSHGVSSGA